MESFLRLMTKKRWTLYLALKILRQRYEGGDITIPIEIENLLALRLILIPENAIEEMVETGWEEIIIDTIKFLKANKQNFIPIYCSNQTNYVYWSNLEDRGWVLDVLMILYKKSQDKHGKIYENIWETITD